MAGFMLIKIKWEYLTVMIRAFTQHVGLERNKVATCLSLCTQ